MELENYSSEHCQKAFMAMREKTQKLLQKTNVLQKEEVAIDRFTDVCFEAAKNDPVAQDYLSYIFKKGLQNVVPVNYEKHMQWQILAGANGNQYSIDKMALFLNYALSEIMMVDDIAYIIKRNNLTEENYQYVIGRLICEAIADELRLDAENLIKEPLVHQEFDSRVMRNFDRARNFVIPKILKFLRN